MYVIYVVMERLGPVLMDVVLLIPPARFVNINEAGAGIDGSSVPDTASDDETLGPVYEKTVLPIPPVGLMY